MGFPTALFLSVVVICSAAYVSARDTRAMATSESKSAVNVPDERVNVALHFNSSEEGSNEVFSNLYIKLYEKNGSRKKKRTITDPDDFHCYKGNGKL